jgi:hypothetical protein
MFGDCNFGIRYNYVQLNFDKSKEPNFEASFNTLKHKVKGSIGNEKLFKNFGFKASLRWNGEYLWE